MHSKVEINNDKDYQKTREIISSQKLNMERALVRFKIKSDPKKAFSLFNEDPMHDSIFFIIENDPTQYSYLNAFVLHDTDIWEELKNVSWRIYFKFQNKHKFSNAVN